MELSKPGWNVGGYGKYFHDWEKAWRLNAEISPFKGFLPLARKWQFIVHNQNTIRLCSSSFSSASSLLKPK
jgi:hypothetical protein